MFKKEIAHNETYKKDSGNDYEIDTSLTAYEVYIELGHDKEGNVLKDKNGRDRYFAVDDDDLKVLDAPVTVRAIREGLYKPVYPVLDDYVEKVERDGKRFYYIVDPSKIVTLEAGTTVVVTKSGAYKTPSEIGFVIVDDTVIEEPRTVGVRQFKTEDHKAEAEEAVKKSRYQHRI